MTGTNKHQIIQENELLSWLEVPKRRRDMPRASKFTKHMLRSILCSKLANSNVQILISTKQMRNKWVTSMIVNMLSM